MEKNKVENADFLMADEAEDLLPKDPLVIDVMSLHFSVGNIFWTMKSGKRLFLFRPGDWIRKEYLQKFLLAQKEIDIDPIINLDYCSEGRAILFELRDCDDEEEKAKSREKFIKWFSKGFWKGEAEVSLLDLVFVCEQAFYGFTKEDEEELFEISGELFKRSSVVSALFTSLSIIVGYIDYELLKDLYHLSFLFDYSLDQSTLSTNLINALESERVSPSSWASHLSEKEIETFRSHAKEGAQKSLTRFEKNMSNPGLLHFIETHHERINGAGFPLGLLEGEISDLEALIIFINNRISYKKIDFSYGDSSSYLKEMIKKGEETQNILSTRIKKILTSELENIELDHDRYLEVAGI